MKTLLKRFGEWAIVWNRLNDFQKARWKLTGIYILLLFFVLNIFTGSIFFVLQKEEKNHQQTIENAWQKKEIIFPNKHITIIEFQKEATDLLTPQEIFDLQHMFLQTVEKWILIIEFLLLFFSSFLSYFLSGKTLFPIEKKNKKQQQFLSDVSHELKNPLSAIHTSLEIAKAQTNWKQGELKELFSDIEAEISRLIDTTKDLLFLEKRRKVLQKTPKNIAPLLQKNIDTLLPFAKKHNISFRVQQEDCVIDFFEQDVERVIFNLLHNAIKFSFPNKEIYIQLSQTGKLIIQDFGQGIAKKDIPYIFDRLYKSDTSRTFTDENGSGLGLSIVKKICDDNHWNLSVQSKKGKGTIFAVSFV